MPKGSLKGSVKRRRVTLSLDFPAGKEVFLLGDFNDWHPTKHAMKREGDGLWKKTVMLSPGKYEYRFKVDGEWINDPNSRMCPNRFGTFNNFIEVS